jgi:hypothetical protein
MSTLKKRKAEEDNDQLSSKPQSKSKFSKQIPSVIFLIYIENRSSIDNNPTINQIHYSPSSSDTSHIWNPIDSLNSSFSSTSSNSDYDSISSLHSSESKSNIHLTTDQLSMIYNPNHQIIKQEEHGIKRELSPQLNGTPPQKKKSKNDGISALPTPPSSTGYSSVVEKMMVRYFELSGFEYVE